MLNLSQAAQANRLTFYEIDVEIKTLVEVYLQGYYSYRQLASMADMPVITLWRKMNKYYNDHYNK